MKLSFYVMMFLASSLIITSCKKQGSGDDENRTAPATAPDGFNYPTFKKADLNIRVLTNTNIALKSVVVQLYSTKDKTRSKALYKGLTDANGYLKGSFNIPAYMDTLLVDAGYVGLTQGIKVLFKNNFISCTIGGTAGVTGNIALSLPNNKIYSGSTIVADTKISFMGAFNSEGRPESYLESKPDPISENLLLFTSFSLPESSDVRGHHPQYLKNDVINNLVITEKADVWVTYVAEGAGNLNSIGYYTYPTGRAPKTEADIEEIKLMLPNSSGRGSGGDMVQGDKIMLGRFDAGTTIGFVLFEDGWDRNGKTVKSKAARYYTNDALNPEPTAELKKHTVMLNYKAENLFLLGFEDLNRNTPACDQDFNDVLLFATSNPVTAISPEGVPSIDQPNDVDTDDDGVSDVFDQFPKDKDKAYITYFPSAKTWGTLAYEDLWPNNGDYDLNDLVVNYRYTFIANAKNDVVEFSGEYAVIAAGAAYEDGFGVEFPFKPEEVAKVSGQSLQGGTYVRLRDNGLEDKQEKAVIIPFDNYRNLILPATGSTYINTDINQPKVSGKTVTVNVVFKEPMPLTTLGNAPFNPFLISNQRRAIEVHLPGNYPTSLADIKLFNTGDDDYNLNKGKLYLGKKNQPWGLSFVETFDYMVEGTSIEKGYLHFNDWISSGGTMYTDWYSNTSSGYRNPFFIYSK